MANFTTHIAVGTVVSGALATLTLAADVVAPENLVAVTLAGVLGSVLPDIDLKDSRASKTMFAGLGIFFSFAALFNAATKFSIAELWIIWLGTLVLVRYGLHYVFHRTSVHRGIWHSLIAGVFSSVATALVFFYVLKKPEGVAWLAAGFMMIGYITHLVLDEMYSVDVMDTRIKASFGTALKIFDRRYPSASLAMTAAAAAAIYVAPPTKMFVDGVRTEGLWSGLHQRMLPKDKWFGVIATHRSSASQGAGGEQGAVTTGSITPAKITQPTSTEAPAAVPQAPLAPAPTPQQ
ncbi:MAG: metal-dependent hydrolase [Hyphomicrobium sp.]|nr:metal-dependent hydrolase [Hyphomicrobium sp.]